MRVDLLESHQEIAQPVDRQAVDHLNSAANARRRRMPRLGYQRLDILDRAPEPQRLTSADRAGMAQGERRRTRRPAGVVVFSPRHLPSKKAAGGIGTTR